MKNLIRELILESLRELNNGLGSIELIKKALSRVQYDKDMAVNLLVQKSKEAGGSQEKIYQDAITLLSKMNNSDIKNMLSSVREEEQPEPYDAETDMFAPGPRQRPEDWKQGGGGGGRKPIPQKVNKIAVKKSLDVIGKMKNHEWRPLLDRARKNYELFPDDGNDPAKLNLAMALQYIDEHPELK